MKQGLFYSLLTILLCYACSGGHIDLPDAPVTDEPASGGVGFLSLTLTAAGTSTRATDPNLDTQEFLITIYKGSEQVGNPVRLKDLNPVLDAGYGYRLQAENCTADDAETANDGWGQKHFRGLSASFAIEAGQTTSVKVACSVANAGVSIAFDPDFRKRYPKCVVKLDKRNVSWSLDEDEPGQTPRVAYCNVTENGTRTVTLLVYLNGGEDTEPIEREIPLEAKKVSTLTLKPKTEAEGFFSLSITYDSDFEETDGSDKDVVVEE